MQDYTKLNDKAQILKAIGHPVRLCIVGGLLGKACNVTTMQECLELPQAVVSQHLAVLKEKGIVRGERHGTEIIYHVENETVKALVSVLFEEA